VLKTCTKAKLKGIILSQSLSRSIWNNSEWTRLF